MRQAVGLGQCKKERGPEGPLLMLHRGHFKVRCCVAQLLDRREPADILNSTCARAGCYYRVFKPDVELDLIVDELLEIDARDDVFVCSVELSAGVAEHDGNVAEEEVLLVLALTVKHEGDGDVAVIRVVFVLNVLEVGEDAIVLTLCDFACKSVVHEVSE